MSYVTLRKVSTPNVAPATGFTVLWSQWDTDARIEVQDATQSPTAVTFELAARDEDAGTPGALVQAFCVGTTRREVRYAGDGHIYTQDVPNSISCASSLVSITVVPFGVTRLDGTDGRLIVTWSGGTPPFRVRCALVEPGRDDNATCDRRLAAPSFIADFVADARNPLPPGRYRVQVEEVATGFVLDGEGIIDLRAGDVSAPDRIGLYGPLTITGINASDSDGPLTVRRDFQDRRNPVPSGAALEPVLRGIRATIPTQYTILSLEAKALTDNSARVAATLWDRTTNTGVTAYTVTFDDTQEWLDGNYSNYLPGVRYCLPAGTLVYAAPTGDICSNGQGGIYVRGAARVRPLRLENYILTHPDRPGEATGGLLVEVAQQAHPDAPALTFLLLDAAGGTVASNDTGRFSRLDAGTYRVQVTPSVLPAAYSALEFTVTLTARYGLNYVLDFDDVRLRKACRLEIWTEGYTGAALPICGQADVVSLRTEGLPSGALQNDLPDSVGTELQALLSTEPGELEDLFLSDRKARLDAYYDGGLAFSGYLEPGIYTEPLLAGPVPVTLTATCGLAALKDTYFTSDHNQELRGRWPVLHTLFHCLSRCDLALPLTVIANRRALEMTTDEVPELAMYTDRLAYVNSDNTPGDCRAVIDAICQALGGTLVQRDGEWQLRCLIESGDSARGRRYLPGGEFSYFVLVDPPTFTLVPPGMAVPGERFLRWFKGDQERQRRPGWKSYTAAGDAGFTSQAFREGDYFALGFAWNAAGTALQPFTGWRAGAAAAATPNFGLKLVTAGDQGDTVATQWAAVSPGSNYLESEAAPLATGREALPMRLSVTAKFLTRNATLTTGGVTIAITPPAFTELLVEIVAETAAGALVSSAHTLRFELETEVSAGYTTVTCVIPLGLRSGLKHPRVRLHPVAGLSASSPSTGAIVIAYLLVQKAALELLPQGAEWNAATEFTATGPAGTSRPQEALAVKHLDVPAAAGIYAGNPFAFRNSVSRGVAGPTTLWRRAADLKPATLLAACVLDVLAYRGAPSQALVGTVEHSNAAHPLFGDTVDTPYEPRLDGRRWFVASTDWSMRTGRTTITVLEDGPGTWLNPPGPLLPDGARVIGGLTRGRRRIRVTHRGIRVVNT